MTLYQDGSSRHASSKTWPYGGLIFLYIYIEHFKKSYGFNITWQKCFLVTLYFRLKPSWWFVSGSQGAGFIALVYLYIENFKNILVRNHWTDYVKCWRVGGWGYGSLVALYFYIENFKNVLGIKPMDQFQCILAGMFLWWPSAKIVQALIIRQKTWLPLGGAFFPCISILKTLKIFLSETTGPISI